MSLNPLRDALDQGRTVIGLCTMFPAPGLIEVMAGGNSGGGGASGGYDFIWIDGQHGQMDYAACLAAARTCTGCGVSSVIRVPNHDAGLLGMFADIAPQAIMVPMVNTPQQAAAIASALCFPPDGQRSYGGRRLIDLHGRDNYNQTGLIAIAQIETMTAVQNARAIADTPNIDMLFFGPDDMRCQLGLPMSTPILENEQLLNAMRQTGKAARDAGKFAGCVAGDAASIQAYADAGYQLIVVGGDVAFLRPAVAQRLAMVRQVLDREPATEKNTDNSGAY